MEVFQSEIMSLKCVDADLGKACADTCQVKIDECLEFCDDPNCNSRCQGQWLDCLAACPCYSGCPDGCENCPNPICQGPSEHLFIIDVRMEEFNKGMHWNSDTGEVEFRNFDYQVNQGFDIEDSCYAMMNGEHWLLGGWFNPDAVAKIENCQISRQASTLEFPFHGGIFGSCASFRNKIYTCFDGRENRTRECITFDGKTQEIAAGQTTRGHDWSDLVVHDDELVTVGGCDGDGENCHGVTEIYGRDDGWVSHSWADFPVHELTNHAMVSDSKGIIIITDSSYDNTIYHLDFLPNNVYRWATLGQLRESAFNVSATSILGDVFIGYNNLERIRIDEREISATIVYETGFELRLDHAPFLAVDANFCKEE
ncbi:Oidioi.mRNA.OKI2018_I69.PAR.g9919.t1.cds [Oikopleura dioica]|uniref:Oidioi.mRNA.OKI2018_I69.PAR.g9919.t1.cds n=1 Tax=Oikopleura dioica TaxID=34765 RepID=A0ABN7RRH7_OIKDI|nr:Oidioi.mRNA.OKI2018_I69.PAR.g9919.t1.cds [Oikopleura dioica]